MSVLAESTFLVTRTRLSLTDLDLNSGTAYSGMNVVEWGPGKRVMNLITASSPVSNGNIVISATAGIQDAVVVVRVWGSPSEVLSQIEDLEIAFSQLEYMLTVELADNSEMAVLQCSPADLSLGRNGVWQSELLEAGWQDVEITIPVQPTPRQL